MDTSDIKRNVLRKIEAEGITPKPRSFFWLRMLATALVALLALAASTLVMSFIIFALTESGERYLLSFGGGGVAAFLALFPWLVFGFDVVLILILEWLIKGLKIGYRHSLLSTLAAIVCLSLGLGALVTLTPLHRHFLSQADKGELPLVGELYEQIRDSHTDKGVYRGTVVSITGLQAVISHSDSDKDDDDGTHTVLLPAGHVPVSVGDRLYVFGFPDQTGVIHAQGVRIVPLDR